MRFAFDPEPSGARRVVSRVVLAAVLAVSVQVGTAAPASACIPEYEVVFPFEDVSHVVAHARVADVLSDYVSRMEVIDQLKGEPVDSFLWYRSANPCRQGEAWEVGDEAVFLLRDTDRPENTNSLAYPFRNGVTNFGEHIEGQPMSPTTLEEFLAWLRQKIAKMPETDTEPRVPAAPVGAVVALAVASGIWFDRRQQRRLARLRRAPRL